MAASLLEAYFKPWDNEDNNWRWSRKGDTSKDIKDGNGRPGAVSPALGVKGWKSSSPVDVSKVKFSKEQIDSTKDPMGC